jgi:hypothetical protein
MIVETPLVEKYVGASVAEVASAEASYPVWTVSLLGLPNELIECIFFYAHPLEVVKCRQVRVRHVVDARIFH